jgi:hypothetical protein
MKDGLDTCEQVLPHFSLGLRKRAFSDHSRVAHKTLYNDLDLSCLFSLTASFCSAVTLRLQPHCEQVFAD